jgi:predicted NodU family carbamoyl transferase
MPEPWITTGEAKKRYGYNNAVNILKKWGWDGTPFECVILGTHFSPEMGNDYSVWTRRALINKRWWFMLHEDSVKPWFPSKEYKVVCTHHHAHASCGFYQSSFDKAFIFSMDGGGDDGAFNLYQTYGNDGIKLVERLDYNIGRSYSKFGLLITELAKTPNYDDLPGKIMGYSAFGEHDPLLASYLKQIFKFTETLENYDSMVDVWYKALKCVPSFDHKTRDAVEKLMNVTLRVEDSETKDMKALGKMKGYNNLNNSPKSAGNLFQINNFHGVTDDSFVEWPGNPLKNLNELYKDSNINGSSMLTIKEKIMKKYSGDTGLILRPKFGGHGFKMKGKEAQNFLYNVQIALTEIIVEEVGKVVSHIRNKFDGNLVLTGGVALNVITNEALLRAYPDLKIFVPPNPQDAGLAFGSLKEYLYQTNNNTQKATITYSGVPFRWNTPTEKILEGKEITLNHFVRLLKAGKIIGFVQGNSEVGPRALGNRSILCDASYPDMKHIINAKVKGREWFRPFAPVCRLEDVNEYFETKEHEHFNNLEFMSFAVKVRDKYKNKLKSITHVDGTARIQTVTRKQNAFLYDLLTKFKSVKPYLGSYDTPECSDGVLLNTSFNVQGKPILNTSSDAMKILNKTQLDYFIYRKGNKLFLIEKE